MLRLAAVPPRYWPEWLPGDTHPAHYAPNPLCCAFPRDSVNPNFWRFADLTVDCQCASAGEFWKQREERYGTYATEGVTNPRGPGSSDPRHHQFRYSIDDSSIPMVTTCPHKVQNRT